MAEPMSDERLAACCDLSQLIRRHTWTAAEDAADAIRDLADEVKRLRAQLVAERLAAEAAEAENDRLRTQAAYMREQIEQQAQVIEERKTQTVAYRALVEEHQKRGDKLSAQLAEIGETRLEFGYRFPDGYGDPDVQGYDDEATARRLANHGDTVMRRRAGDWEVLPDA